MDCFWWKVSVSLNRNEEGWAELRAWSATSFGKQSRAAWERDEAILPLENAGLGGVRIGNGIGCVER